MNQSPVKNHRTFILLSLFAIAMGALEAIVVVYLRQFYYPEGFDFPLTLLSPRMLAVECTREAAIIVMLVSVGIMADCPRKSRHPRGSVRWKQLEKKLLAAYDIAYVKGGSK